MSRILKRDDYIKEIYTPMVEKQNEQKKYEELVAVNEGLLKTLFGMAKNLFKKDWASIKGDPGIIKVYKELDDQLTGFSTMKLSKKGECNKIRQVLVDFACDWYDKKMNDAKKSDTDPKPAKSMKFKDDTLRENLANVERKIKEIAGDDEQMLKWANTLKEDMKNVINRTILDDITDKEARAELEKKIKEANEKTAKVNKAMEEWQNEQLTEIQKERNQLISDAKADPDFIKEGLLGDKAVQNLVGEYVPIAKAKNDEKPELFKKDKTFGLQSIFTDDDYQGEDGSLKSEFKTTSRLMNSFYRKLNDDMDQFKNTPGQSVHAMCIAVNAFIKNCVYNSTDYGDALPIMTKCAIMSNGLVSYNLPLNGKTGDEAGNYFTDTIIRLMNNDYKDKTGKDIKLPDNFNQSAKTLFSKIKDEAEKLNKEATKKYKESLKKLTLENE